MSIDNVLSSNGEAAAPLDPSRPKEKLTFQPLSNSPLAAKLAVSDIPQGLLVAEPPLPLLVYDKLAPPETLRSTACADTEARDAAIAVKPIFFKLFI